MDEAIPTGVELTALDKAYREDPYPILAKLWEQSGLMKNAVEEILQSFVGGRHICMGAHLARLEAQETFFALSDHFSEIHAVEGRHEYSSIPSFRSLKELWVRVVR